MMGSDVYMDGIFFYLSAKQKAASDTLLGCSYLQT